VSGATRNSKTLLARGAPLLLAAALAAGFARARAGEDVLPAPLKARIEQIKVESIKKHEEFLTSDECAGRDTGQAGLTKARDYLVEHHTQYGLTGAGEGGSFLYDFEVPTRTWSDD